MTEVIMLIIAMLIASPAIGSEISDDGRETAEPSGQPGYISVITDEVPLPASPDYTCNLRMQVGGMDFGDFDNDGDLDLAVGCYHSQSYPPYNDWRNFVLINNNGQLESTPSWFSSDSSSTTDVKWADLNGDGYLDLFACNGDFSLDPNVIYFGSADGLAHDPGWFANDETWTLSAAPLDFDHDGDIDVATANEGVDPDPTRPVYIYYNNGNGLINEPYWQSSDEAISDFVSWGDVDNDGWYDLAVAKWVNYETCVYFNNQGAMVTTPGWTSGSTRSDKGVAWADVDADTFPELAVGGTDPTWLFDNVEGVLGNTPIWDSNNSYHGCQDIGWGDIDNDGDPDLSTVEFSTAQIRIYLNIDGVLSETPSWVYRASGAGTALAFGDVNGDGLLDLAMGQSGQPCVMVFLNTGPVSVKDELPRPVHFSLHQNYPNPFNASSTIEFETESKGYVSLTVYDLLGNKVDVPVSGVLDPGIHSVVWEARGLSSGIYYYTLTSADKTESKRMLLLK